MAPSPVDYFPQILSRVVEHTLNLGVETRDDNGVKESVQTCKYNSTDDHSYDYLHTRINVAFGFDALDGALCADSERIYLVLDIVNKIFHY